MMVHLSLILKGIIICFVEHHLMSWINLVIIVRYFLLFEGTCRNNHACDPRNFS